MYPKPHSTYVPLRELRERRLSTRLGIALLIALAIMVVAIVWGVERWSESDMEGPSVHTPVVYLAT